jgi:phosphatidylserine/phosphatidylglycerophosphate/cardiolipin synthase-like enzyme
LSQRAKNTTVRILAPPIKQIKSNQKALTRLNRAGAIVKTLQSPYIHAKLIMVDNKNAYVGSVNLTKQSMDGNRELGIILSKRDDLYLLERTFLKDWENAHDL